MKHWSKLQYYTSKIFAKCLLIDFFVWFCLVLFCLLFLSFCVCVFCFLRISSLWTLKTQKVIIRRSVKDVRHAEFTSLLSDKIQPITNQAKLFISAASGVVRREERPHDPFWTSQSHYVELDSASYTANSKLTGPEHIHLFFSPCHCFL